MDTHGALVYGIVPISFCGMLDDPAAVRTRAAVVQAARRLAITLDLASRLYSRSAETDIRVLERAVAAYVATLGAGRPRQALADEIEQAVRVALRTDELIVHAQAVIDVVAGLSRREAEHARRT